MKILKSPILYIALALVSIFLSAFLLVRNLIKNVDYSFEGFDTIGTNFKLKFFVYNKSVINITFSKVNLSILDNVNRSVLSFKPIENIVIKKGQTTELEVETSTMDLGTLISDIALDNYENYKLLVRTKVFGIIPLSYKSNLKSLIL